MFSSMLVTPTEPNCPCPVSCCSEFRTGAEGMAKLLACRSGGQCSMNTVATMHHRSPRSNTARGRSTCPTRIEYYRCGYKPPTHPISVVANALLSHVNPFSLSKVPLCAYYIIGYSGQCYNIGRGERNFDISQFL